MRPFLLSVLGLAALALAAPTPTRAEDDKDNKKKTEAEEAYTIKVLKFLPKGKAVKVNAKRTIKFAAKFTDDNDNSMNVDKEQTFLRTYVEKTLDVDEKANKRKKFTRAYEKAKDVEGDESQSKPYQGRTVVFERSGDKWSVEAEGKPELEQDDLKDVSAEINRSEKPDDALYPKKAVKVGDKWALEGKEVAKVFEDLKMDPDTVKASGKLVKAYKKGGQQWGQIEYVINFTSTEVGPLFKNVKGEMKGTVDQALDASTTASKGAFEVKWAGKQTIEMGCQKIKTDFTLEATVDSEVTDAKEDKKQDDKK